MSDGDVDWQALRKRRRPETLKQCMQAQAEWERQPGRNLVLLFDGTGNILGNDSDTNVVKLMRLMNKRRPYEKAVEQIAFYDPGVGTANEFPPAGFFSRSRSAWRKVQGLALGQGAFENVAEGYEFLCREYRPGDRIWLFGFSRGAFTARAVGGMVNMYGLVYPSGLAMVRTLVRTYFSEAGEPRDRFAMDVIRQFALDRTPLVHFTGVWDTVDSIGLTGGVTITNSSQIEHKRFVHIRHALSLHETREKYRPREYTAPAFTEEEKAFRSFKQCWFRGVHSDVGGSYHEAGLSNITLNWMVEEARQCGLEFSIHSPAPEDPLQSMHDQVLDSPYWLLTGINTRERASAAAPVDRSALPVDAATPARRTTKTWLARHAGLVLFLLAGALFLAAWHAGKAACNLERSPDWLASIPFAFRLLAPFADPLDMVCAVPGIRAAIGWDFAFLAAFWLWLPYPLAWAVRRCCDRAIDAGLALPAALRRVHLALWGVLGAAVAGNLLAWHLPGHAVLAWAVMVLTAAKLAGLLWALAVFVAGALAGRAGRPSPLAEIR